jgi:hypothetical protein
VELLCDDERKEVSFSGSSKPNAMNKPKKYTTSPSAEQWILLQLIKRRDDLCLRRCTRETRKVDDGIQSNAHCERGSGNPALCVGRTFLGQPP